MGATGAVFLGPASTADTGCPTAVQPPLSAGVYQVSAPAHLMWIKEANVGGVDAQFADSYLMVNDIDLSGCTWSRGIADAAGTGNCVSVTDGCFTGVFDGGGFAVSNLTITATSGSGSQWVGFIGNLVGGTVRNLTVSGSVTAAYTGGSGFSSIYVGLVAGYMRSGASAIDITAIGSVTGTNGDNLNVGGAIGQYNLGTVRGVSSDVIVSASCSCSPYVGGALGYTYGSFEDVEATGSVTVTSAGTLNVGGITGYISNSSAHIASDLHADLTMAISGASTVYAGGIVGQHASPTMARVSTAGSITVTGVAGGQVGGIAGGASGSARTIGATSSMDVTVSATSNVYFGGLYGMTGSVAITDSAATGDVIGTITAGSYSAGLYGGGLAGYGGSGSITRSSASGNVRLVALGTTPTSELYAGGLFGLGAMDIEQSFSTGSVVAEQGTADRVHAGGLVGYATADNIYQAYALGDVTVTATGGDVFAGGLIGAAYATPHTIEQTYSRGIVSVTSTGTTHLHSLVGYSSGTGVIASVCRSQVSSAVCDTNGEGTPTSRADMEQLTTYTALNWPMSDSCTFGSDWGICPTINGGTPFLRAFGSAPSDPSQTPPSWLRGFARAVDVPCPEGWGSSWAQWPHGGQGGFVCHQETYWDPAIGGWSTRAA